MLQSFVLLPVVKGPGSKTGSKQCIEKMCWLLQGSETDKQLTAFHTANGQP